MQEAEDDRFKDIEPSGAAEPLGEDQIDWETLKQAIFIAIDAMYAAAEDNKEIYFDPEN